MAAHPRLTILDLRARPVNVPMRIPLQTSGGTVGVAELRGPGTVWQESGAGTLINELIKDALQQLGGA